MAIEETREAIRTYAQLYKDAAAAHESRAAFVRTTPFYQTDDQSLFYLGTGASTLSIVQQDISEFYVSLASGAADLFLRLGNTKSNGCYQPDPEDCLLLEGWARDYARAQAASKCIDDWLQVWRSVQALVAFSAQRYLELCRHSNAVPPWVLGASLPLYTLGRFEVHYEDQVRLEWVYAEEMKPCPVRLLMWMSATWQTTSDEQQTWASEVLTGWVLSIKARTSSWSDDWIEALVGELCFTYCKDPVPVPFSSKTFSCSVNEKLRLTDLANRIGQDCYGHFERQAQRALKRIRKDHASLEGKVKVRKKPVRILLNDGKRLSTELDGARSDSEGGGYPDAPMDWSMGAEEVRRVEERQFQLRERLATLSDDLKPFEREVLRCWLAGWEVKETAEKLKAREREVASARALIRFHAQRPEDRKTRRRRDPKK